MSDARIRHNTHATGTEKLRGHLAMVLFAAVIAGSFSFGKLAAPFIDPKALNAARFVLAASILAGIMLATRRRIPAPPGGFRGIWRYGVMGGLMATYFVTMFEALRLTSPVSTGAMFTLIPLMSAGFGWLFMRQKARASVLAGLLVAAAGSLWMIFRGDLSAMRAFDLGPGERVFFFGCVAYAAYAPLVRFLHRGEGPLAFAFFNQVAMATLVGVVGAGAIGATDWGSLPGAVWFALIYLSLMATVVSVTLMQYASLRLPASKVLSYGYLTPAFIILYEGLLGHGWVPATVMLGALVTALALVIVAFAPDG